MSLFDGYQILANTTILSIAPWGRRAGWEHEYTKERENEVFVGDGVRQNKEKYNILWMHRPDKMQIENA